MIVQLITGKSVEIPTKMFLEMDDTEWNDEMTDLVCHNMGKDINDAFYLSSLTINSKDIKKATCEDGLDEIEELEIYDDLDFNLEED